MVHVSYNEWRPPFLTARNIFGIRDSEFERLYGAHAQAIYRFLLYRTGDPALSEDLLADTFEKVLRSRMRWPSEGPQKPWLYKVALNTLRDSARRARTEARALEQVAAASAEAPSVDTALEDRDRVQRALMQLSDEEREAIALRFGADLTVPEIARTLRVSLTTAEGRVYRGLRKLREVLR
jgi:RNA polymerase sigma-70 factor (ECF subfamily)